MVLLVFVICVILGFTKAEQISEKIVVEVVAGEVAELPCNVTPETPGDKLNVFVWYINDSSTAFYSSRDLRSEDETTIRSLGTRYRLVTGDNGVDMLQIISAKPSDEGDYHCLADFAASPAVHTYIRLDVIEPPIRLWVVHQNGTRVASATAGVNVTREIGPYFIGDEVNLFCVVFGGKPRPTISWYVDQDLLKNTSTPLSEQRIRSELQLQSLRREDSGKMLSCVAQNYESAPTLIVRLIVDLYLPPELITVRAESSLDSSVGRGRAGSTLHLQCRALGAQPPAEPMWYLQGEPMADINQNVTIETGQRLVVSRMELKLSADLDEAAITCCFLLRPSTAATICAPTLTLAVSYPPVLEILVNEQTANNSVAVLKGINVVLNCSFRANPSVYLLAWFHQDDIVDRDKEETTLQRTLEIANATENDSGEYVCAATNDEGSTYSEPVILDVTYPAYCEDESIAEYGLAEGESVNITCHVHSNPLPTSYRWVLINEAISLSDLKSDHHYTTVDNEEASMSFQRPNGTVYSTVFCWGINGITSSTLPNTPCTFLVTDQTVPRPPRNCRAIKNALDDISVTCEKGHDGGLPQKFLFTVKSLDNDKELVSVINVEPSFIIQKPNEENYKFVIAASNEKGYSKVIEIDEDDVIDQTQDDVKIENTVRNITTLSLALCGGVMLLVLLACGLTLTAHSARERPHVAKETTYDAYDSSESECNVRRTESFRRAVSRYPSTRTLDLRRTGSFHSARQIQDMHQDTKYPESFGHYNTCKVHSLQNINRKKEMDGLCDHLTMNLPSDVMYIPKTTNTFCTIPRRMRQRLTKEIDETSEVTHLSDGISLPPPPDEFTYRPSSRIRDFPSKSNTTYATISRKTHASKELNKPSYGNVVVPSMNSIGLPTVSSGVYTYPESVHKAQLNNNPFGEDSA